MSGKSFNINRGNCKSQSNHDTAERTASKDSKEEIVREPAAVFVLLRIHPRIFRYIKMSWSSRWITRGKKANKNQFLTMRMTWMEKGYAKDTVQKSY